MRAITEDANFVLELASALEFSEVQVTGSIAHFLCDRDQLLEFARRIKLQGALSERAGEFKPLQVYVDTPPTEEFGLESHEWGQQHMGVIYS